MTKESDIENRFERKRLTLDLIGLSEEERAEGSSLLGGGGAEFVLPGDDFEYNQVGTVVFEWGDPRGENVFAVLLEHDDTSELGLFPFDASAVIADDIWALSIQDKDFDPKTVYQSQDHYRVLPFDKVSGSESLQAFLALPTPRPELIGKVGQRWVAFESGTSLREKTTSDLIDGETVKAEYTKDELLKIIGNVISKWDFDSEQIEATNWFALNVAHWLLETFGRKNYAGEFDFYPDAEGIPGRELPIDLQQLITHEWMDELLLSDENTVHVQTKHEFLETDPVIPEWDKISKITSIPNQLAYIRSHPEIVQGMKKTSVEVVPQVRILFQPSVHVTSWGLELLVSRTGVRIAPFGQAGMTWGAARYVAENQDSPEQMAKTVCELSILGARHCEHGQYGPVPAYTLHVLSKRLRGEAELPLCVGEFQPNPRNSIKNLLIKFALEGSEE